MSRRPLAVTAMVLALAAATLQPSLAAPCPWGTNCITVTQVTPTSGATLSGAVALEARAVQDQPAERGAIIAVEWWLYHPSFADQVPGNVEAKILLDESASPVSGSTLDGTWRGNWTVASTVTTRDGWYDSPGDRTYVLPADDGNYTLEAHVLDEEWVRTWGGPPGRSETVPVTLTFPGSDPTDPGDPTDPTDPGDPTDPTDPGDPTDPTDPGDPTDPTDPGPPPGTQVNIGGLSLPTSVEVLPSGRVYISEKNGAIRTAPDLTATSATTAATVDTYTNGDHGLQSLAYLDGFLYAAYTRQPAGFCDPGDYGQNGRGCVVHGQVDRFPVDQVTGALGSRQAVRGGPGTWCAQFTTHGIDDIVAGEDGFLYISAGDGAGFTGADTGQFDGDPCGDGGAFRSQSTSNLAGNIVRLNPSTGATTTVAHGFRNPYRITFQPGTSNLYVGDVGWYTAEELNLVDTAGAITNHGWPCREGTGPMSFYAGLAACAGVTGTAPIHSYTHDGENAAMSAVGWHDGRVYYGDYHRRFIRSVAPDGTGDRAEATDVMPVDLLSTPAGLIYVDIGRGAVRTVAGSGEPPPSPPFAEVVVSEAPWQPGATIDYAVDFRNLGRQPVEVTWTITLDDANSDAEVVHTDTGAPAGPDGRHSGSFTAPTATHPAALTFTAVVAGADGTSIEASRVRAMAAPATGTPPPPGDGTPPPPGDGTPPPSDDTPPPDDGSTPAADAPDGGDPVTTPEDGDTPDSSDDTDEPSDDTTPPPLPPEDQQPDPGRTPSNGEPTPPIDDAERSPAAITLTDLDGNLHEAAILRMVAAGVIRGFDDGTYRPRLPVTRGQMASLLARALGLDIEPCEQDCTGPSDIAGTTHADAIRAMVDAGLATGFEDGTFRPGDLVTRAQMATFLALAFDLDTEDADHPFTDVAPGSTHETAIAAIRRAGITLGVTETTFRPRDDVQRDQMASFLDRALGTDEEDADTE